MGIGGPNLSIQLNLLKEFKKYEMFIYSCFFDSSYENKDIDFYFVPKEYIINFCSCFNYSKYSNDLEQLIIYMETTEIPENIIIQDELIKNLNEDIGTSLTLDKINNMSLLKKYVSNDIFYINFSKEGSFIPLTLDIWNLFSNNYKYDVILKKKGFIIHGEIFIITEEEKKIDCFFTLFSKNDLIYHYCFVMDDYNEFENLIKFFNMKEEKYCVKYLLAILKIDIANIKNFQKFKIQIPKNVSIIDKYYITIYFIDSFKFHLNEDKNFDQVKDRDKKLYSEYYQQDKKINSIVNYFQKNHNT